MLCMDSSSLHCSTPNAGGYCFQPIQIFEATTGRPVPSLLRPGKRPSGEEVEQILRHVIGRIRCNWPAVEIMVRGDSHFATPEVMDLLEEKRCGYIFGLSTNPRLTEIGRLALPDQQCSAAQIEQAEGGALH
jgi:hypothetical protein